MNIIPSTVSVKIVPPEPVENRIEITLSLSMKDAENIYTMTSFIGGDRLKSTRGVFDSLRLALRSAGVKDSTYVTTRGSNIYFLDWS